MKSLCCCQPKSLAMVKAYFRGPRSCSPLRQKKTCDLANPLTGNLHASQKRLHYNHSEFAKVLGKIFGANHETNLQKPKELFKISLRATKK